MSMRKADADMAASNMADRGVAGEEIHPPDEAGAPPVVRLAFRSLLGLLAAGALYLIAVRREAILIDLANFSAWCL